MLVWRTRNSEMLAKLLTPFVHAFLERVGLAAVHRPCNATRVFPRWLVEATQGDGV